MAQTAHNAKESWGPTRTIIYRGKALPGPHALLSESCALSFVLYYFSLDLGSPVSPVGYCDMLGAIGLHSPVGRGVLPSLILRSAGVQASGFLLLARSGKTCSSQEGSLTLPSDSPCVSVCAWISTEIPHSSCPGIFSSSWWKWLFSAPHQAGSCGSSW